MHHGCAIYLTSMHPSGWHTDISHFPLLFHLQLHSISAKSGGKKSNTWEKGVYCSKKYSKMCLRGGGRHPTRYFPRRHTFLRCHTFFLLESKREREAIHHANELHFHIFTFFFLFELWEKQLCAPGEGENYKIQSKARREELVKSKTRRRRELGDGG